jgi:hypothetical protein
MKEWLEIVMDFENPVAGTLFAVKELDDFQFD